MKVIIFFVVSILLTAVFSYSLQVFLREDYVTLTLKTMLIPCFTWLVLVLSASGKFTPERFSDYCTIAGVVCVAGSAMLLPGGLYNFIAVKPNINISIVNVLACVFIMSMLFYILLRRNGFSISWWWAYNVLICINMGIFYFVAVK